MAKPGVLLDRDGTIIEDSGYVGSVESVKFIDGAISAIASLNRAGIPVAVVTNQAGVARGYYGIEDVEQVHKHMIAELGRLGAHVDLWLYCPYHPDGIIEPFARTSLDRKPGPGLALAAAEALELDLASSWVVGDSACDVGLATAVGARPLFIGDPNGLDADVDCFPNLASAVQSILADVEQDQSAPIHFPKRRYPDAGPFGTDYTAQLTRAMESVDLEQLAAAARVLGDAYDRDSAVFSCGNGGSASVANHMQCDHVKGVGNGTGLLNRVWSLSTNAEMLTAVANDCSYELVFEHQLRSFARPGDVLVAVSSSGRSPNIVRALGWANDNGLHTVAFTGFSGGEARALASVAVHVDSHNYGVVEDAHQACMHLLAQFIRQSRMSSDVVAATIF